MKDNLKQYKKKRGEFEKDFKELKRLIILANNGNVSVDDSLPLYEKDFINKHSQSISQTAKKVLEEVLEELPKKKKLTKIPKEERNTMNCLSEALTRNEYNNLLNFIEQSLQSKIKEYE